MDPLDKNKPNDHDDGDDDDDDSDDVDYQPGKESDEEDEANYKYESSGESEPDESDDNKIKTKAKRKSKLDKHESKVKTIRSDEPNKNEVLPSKEEEEAAAKKKSDELWASFLKDVKSTTSTTTTTRQAVSSSSISVSQSKTVVTSATAGSSANTLSTLTAANQQETKLKDLFGDGSIKLASSLTSTSASILADPKTDMSKAVLSHEKPKTSKPAGLSNILGKLGKESKISTLEKSRQDWNQFKQSEKIDEDLAIHSKGKDSYLERKAFLERADMRQFELEKAFRNRERKNP